MVPGRTSSPVAMSNSWPTWARSTRGEMRGVVANENGGVSGYFVGDPAAAHDESLLSSRLSVLSETLFIRGKKNHWRP